MKTFPGLNQPYPIEPLEPRVAPAAAVLDLSTLNSANGVKVNGLAEGDAAGFSVSAVGDVNGDSFADFIIGAPEADANGIESGALYVVFGTTSGLPGEFSAADLDGTTGFQIVPEAQGDGAGYSVSGGDVNGDGLSDVIIGAPFSNANGTSSGAAYIVYGRTTFAASLNLGFGSLGVTKIIGELATSLAGFSVSSAGDLNNDGRDEVIIGAPGTDGSAGIGSGAVYVLFGATSYPTPLFLSGDMGGFKVEGGAENDAFGLAVGGAGDINNDSFDDIIIGTPNANGLQIASGVAYVIFGGVSVGGQILFDGTDGFRMLGRENIDSVGAAVSGIGDINNDGFDDIAVGAPGEDSNGVDSGMVYVIYGKASGFAAELDLSSVANVIGFTIVGQPSDFLGTSVSAAGDFNRDGVNDFIIGAAATQSGKGAAYFIQGGSPFPDQLQASALDGSIGFTILGEAKGDLAGFSVAGVGDFNRDGFTDVIIGAPESDGDASNSGSAYIVYGFDTRLTVTAGGQVVSLTDADGDIVTLKLSQGGLSAQDIVLAPDGTIASIDLTGLAPPSPIGGKIKPLNIQIGVKTPFGGSGDGMTKVGLLNAEGLSLGKLKLKGDLGRLIAGFSGDGVAAKNISILGNLGTSTGAATLSKILGGVGKLKILGNFQKDSIEVTGKLKSLTIGGDFEGPASLAPELVERIATEGFESVSAELGANPFAMFLADSIGRLKIGGSIKGGSIATNKGLGPFSLLGDFQNGNLFGGDGIKSVKVLGKIVSDNPAEPVTITARNKLGSLVVNNDVENARILVGYNNDEVPLNPDARVGKVVVKGNWIASSLVAGIADSPADGFGRNDIVIAGETTPAISKIANVIIKGTASGSAALGDHFGITAQQIGKVSINGESVPLTDGADDILIDTTNNDFRVIEIV
jgi:hypothetical protein